MIVPGLVVAVAAAAAIGVALPTWAANSVPSGGAYQPVGSSSAPPTATTSPTQFTVAADGTGQYKTVQAAVDAVAANNTAPVTITIKPGTYRGRVVVPPGKRNITLTGAGTGRDAVVLVDSVSSAAANSLENSATLTVRGSGFGLRNLTVSNDYDETKGASPALALDLVADKVLVDNVRLLGDQDTLLVNETTRAYVTNTYIEGTVDFIFGGGTAVFDNCHIYEKRTTGGPITAASTPTTQTYGFLFYKSTISGAKAGTVRLGRPWRQSAQVVYRESHLSDIATAQPWGNMGNANWQKARYFEYTNLDAGATTNKNRPQLTPAQAVAYTPAKYLAGTDSWDPTTTAKTTTSGTDCTPTSYGAKGDGKTDDTKALQKALDTCAGKGTVRVTSGSYLTGPLTMTGTTTLQLDLGATILASQRVSDYPVRGSKCLPLLLVKGSDKAVIKGQGTIDGQGSPWWSTTRAEKAAHKTLSPRPVLLDLTSVTNASVSGITVKNGPAQNIQVHFSKGVRIDSVTVTAPADSPNTDGIDVMASGNVTITNSTIDVGDDDVAINGNAGIGAAHDVEVSGCTIRHGHGLSIGSGTAGGVYNINMHDNSLTGTQTGIRIKSARDRGGEVKNITYANLTMKGVAYPIEITSYYPSIPADGDKVVAVTKTTPNYHDITIKGITATGATEAGSITGLPEQAITKITLSKVTISAKKGLRVRNACVTMNSVSLIVTSGPTWIKESKAAVS